MKQHSRNVVGIEGFVYIAQSSTTSDHAKSGDAEIVALQLLPNPLHLGYTGFKVQGFQVLQLQPSLCLSASQGRSQKERITGRRQFDNSLTTVWVRFDSVWQQCCKFLTLVWQQLQDRETELDLYSDSPKSSTEKIWVVSHPGSSGPVSSPVIKPDMDDRTAVA